MQEYSLLTNSTFPGNYLISYGNLGSKSHGLLDWTDHHQMH